MTQEEEKQVRDLKEMYRSEGWKVFLNELSEQLELLDTVSDVTTIEELMFRRGEYIVLTQILRHEETLEAMLQRPQESDYHPEPEGY